MDMLTICTPQVFAEHSKMAGKAKPSTLLVSFDGGTMTLNSQLEPTQSDYDDAENDDCMEDTPDQPTQTTIESRSFSTVLSLDSRATDCDWRRGDDDTVKDEKMGNQEHLLNVPLEDFKRCIDPMEVCRFPYFSTGLLRTLIHLSFRVFPSSRIWTLPKRFQMAACVGFWAEKHSTRST